ncbi:MAG: sulfite exporter TauE/SafE family protein [Actinomycetota bacterium]|nr:sulfite exporter TauE/SafE family protein [Actinomycetota bacterium]
MTTAQLIVVAVAVFAAAFVQVIAGFGFALLCMPIMTLAVPVEQAVVVSTLLGMVSTTWQGWHFRADARRPLVRRLTLAAFVGMPLGLVILNVVDDRTLKVVLGVAVLIATAMLVRRINLSHVGSNLDYGAGFLSGVLNTSLSTNGPPLVFDLQARHLAPDEFRATITMVFALSNTVGLSLFLIDGKVTVDGLQAALIALPAWAAGLALGWPIRKHVHGERFRWMVLVLLFAAGTSTIVFALT